LAHSPTVAGSLSVLAGDSATPKVLLVPSLVLLLSVGSAAWPGFYGEILPYCAAVALF
jgi:hypothetical protein